MLACPATLASTTAVLGRLEGGLWMSSSSAFRLSDPPCCLLLGTLAPTAAKDSLSQLSISAVDILPPLYASASCSHPCMPAVDRLPPMLALAPSSPLADGCDNVFTAAEVLLAAASLDGRAMMADELLARALRLAGWGPSGVAAGSARR
jgi:hypothetical protein